MAVRRHPRYSTEFKLRVAEAYLAGEGSANRVAKQYGIPRSLVLIWAEKYRKGELTLDVQREEQLLEYEQKIAALERKVGQLTMELDLLKRGLAVAPLPSSGPRRSSPGRGTPPHAGVPPDRPGPAHTVRRRGARWPARRQGVRVRGRAGDQSVSTSLDLPTSGLGG